MSTAYTMNSSPMDYNPAFLNPSISNDAHGTEVSGKFIRSVRSKYNQILSSLESPINPSFLSEERKRINNLVQLRDISNLKYDWNGNGASPFSRKLISKVSMIFSEMDKQPKIFPTARDSIQFEYERDNGDYLEFEIFEHTIEVYCEMGEQEFEYEIPHDTRKMNRIVFGFYGLTNRQE